MSQQTKHPSHVTRSSNSSLYDEVCTLCGATDITGGGWDRLAQPCFQQKRVVMTMLDSIATIDAMFESATRWGSWMSGASNERSRLVNRLAAEQVHVAPKYEKRIVPTPEQPPIVALEPWNGVATHLPSYNEVARALRCALGLTQRIMAPLSQGDNARLLAAYAVALRIPFDDDGELLRGRDNVGRPA